MAFATLLPLHPGANEQHQLQTKQVTIRLITQIEFVSSLLRLREDKLSPQCKLLPRDSKSMGFLKQSLCLYLLENVGEKNNMQILVLLGMNNINFTHITDPGMTQTHCSALLGLFSVTETETSSCSEVSHQKWC